MKAKFSLSKNPEIKAIFKLTAIVSEQYVEKIYERIDEVQTHVDETNERIDDLYEIKADKTELQDAVDFLDEKKQDTLISGSNIKTINGLNILGSGDILIGGQTSFAEIVGEPYDNEKLSIVLNEKADNTEISRIDNELDTINQTIIDDKAELTQNINNLDEKVDGINVNLTQQIEETQQDINDKYNELLDDISDLSDTVDNNYDELDEKIDSTATTINQRITDVADELGQTIEENVVALQQEDTALQNQINAHSTTLTAYDTRITNNANAIVQEATDRQNDVDNLQDQIDTQSQTLNNYDTRITANTNSIAQETINRQNADDALSDRIDAVESRGRFLALWNATTGLPESTPQITPYTYKTGDYYIVDAVGETNYRPTGTEFIEGQASTEIETEELTTDDVYYYDGAVWRLQVNHGKTVSFGNLTGQPSDNTALKNALDGKQPVGDYATNTALTNGLATKQNTISDLATIRSNAQAGKTASDTIANYGDIVTHDTDEFQPAGDYATNTALTQGLATKQNTITDLDDIRDGASKGATALQEVPSEYITESELQAYHDNTKQDKLVSGANIKTLNNESLLGEGNIDITSAQWGNITGTLSSQTDLQTAIDSKQPIGDYATNTDLTNGLATRADISLSNLDEQGEARLGTQVIIRSW